MVIKPNRNFLSQNGSVQLPYLYHWNPKCSSLLELLDIKRSVFGMHCPVAAAPMSKTQSHSSTSSGENQGTHDPVFKRAASYNPQSKQKKDRGTTRYKKNLNNMPLQSVEKAFVRHLGGRGGRTSEQRKMLIARVSDIIQSDLCEMSLKATANHRELCEQNRFYATASDNVKALSDTLENQIADTQMRFTQESSLAPSVFAENAHVDELVVASDGGTKIIYDAYATTNAADDALGVIERAFAANVITKTQYNGSSRELSKIQMECKSVISNTSSEYPDSKLEFHYKPLAS